MEGDTELVMERVRVDTDEWQWEKLLVFEATEMEGSGERLLDPEV